MSREEGRRKGGFTTYQRYPHIFEKGRMVGLKKIKETRKNRDVKTNPALTEELCEFVGSFIGDGFTSRYNGHYLTQFTGDARYELGYFRNVLAPIAKRTFDLEPKFRVIENTLRMNFYSKSLHLFFTERLQIPTGKKNLVVKIPEEIIAGGQKFILATLRGIADAEGTVFFDLRPAYNKPYPRIQICTTSKSLSEQIRETLRKMSFSIYIREDVRTGQPAFNTEVYGHTQLQRWLKEIGFSNEKHLNKIRKHAPVAQLVDC